MAIKVNKPKKTAAKKSALMDDLPTEGTGSVEPSAPAKVDEAKVSAPRRNSQDEHVTISLTRDLETPRIGKWDGPRVLECPLMRRGDVYTVPRYVADTLRDKDAAVITQGL